jgi:hypothetical protein
VTSAGDAPLPGGDFRLLVQKMGYQALIGLGVVENPLTRERSANLPGARAVLADLRMLREKTAGNLEPDEAEHLDKVLADLAAALEHRAAAGA